VFNIEQRPVFAADKHFNGYPYGKYYSDRARSPVQSVARRRSFQGFAAYLASQMIRRSMIPAINDPAIIDDPAILV
jgi:hypothetical protein